MYKLSPRRSHRSKGFKVKHTLQICLLLAVCFWLLYQLKHSHDKRKEFDTEDETLVNKVQTDGEIQRLGRKDLPRLTDEEKVAEEAANKLEEDELEKEDSRIKDTEEEDEIDENDLDKLDNEDELEKSEAEDTHKKEQVDEDTEKEKNGATTQENHTEDDDSEEEHSESEDSKNTVKNGHTDIGNGGKGYRDDNVALDDQNRDRDEISTNTQEAREEQYKADDASSEVAHNIETGNSTSGHANNVWGEVNFELGNGTRTRNQVDKVINDGASSNITAEFKSTNLMNSSLLISTLPELPNNQTENSSNSSAFLSFNGTQTLSDEKPNLSVGSLLEHDDKSKQATDGYSQTGVTSGSNLAENVITVGESNVSSEMISVSSHNMNSSDTSLADDGKSENVPVEGENAVQQDLIDASDALSRDMVHRDALPLLEIRNEVRNPVNRTTAG